ncbi:MAG: redox-regulated ATPase YchF [Ignavibacteria bacterium]
MQVGIVGLPNVGKSTLFNALTESQNAEASNYPFCTIEPNIGTVIVPDTKLYNLLNIYKSQKVVPSTIEFVDIAGLVKGASKGEGLGNKFLSHIREVDAIAHIVRCFENENVVHIYNRVDPASDIETVEGELIIKDLETVEKRIEKTQKLLKAGDKNAGKELELLNKLRNHLNQFRLARFFTKNLHQEEKEVIRYLHLLSDVPVIYIANVDEESALTGNRYSDIVREIAEKEGASFLILSVEIEAEIANLESADEKREFLLAMGLKQSGLDRLVYESYRLLDLITFYTANERELHSWTIKHGTRAQQAAGKIHTDFERGFIRAEIIKYDDIMKYGSEHLVKENGLLRIEGKDYVVEDGDIIYFRFNV